MKLIDNEGTQAIATLVVSLLLAPTIIILTVI